MGRAQIAWVDLFTTSTWSHLQSLMMIGPMVIQLWPLCSKPRPIFCRAHWIRLPVCVCVCVWCHRCGPVVYLYRDAFAHRTVFPVLGYLGRGTSQRWWTGTKTEPWRAVWARTPKIFISGAVKEKIVITRNISLRKQQLQFLHFFCTHKLAHFIIFSLAAFQDVLPMFLSWSVCYSDYRSDVTTGRYDQAEAGILL